VLAGVVVCALPMVAGLAFAIGIVLRAVAGAAAILAANMLYPIEARRAIGRAAMLTTAPIVAFATFRYLFLILRRGAGGSPDPEVALRGDGPL